MAPTWRSSSCVARTHASKERMGATVVSNRAPRTWWIRIGVPAATMSTMTAPASEARPTLMGT